MPAAFLSLLVLANTLPAHAAAPPALAPAAAASAEPLARLRDELATPTSPAIGGRVPVFTVPDLQLPSPIAGDAPPPARAAAPRNGASAATVSRSSANWLLDAMLQPATQSGRPSHPGGSAGTDDAGRAPGADAMLGDLSGPTQSAADLAAPSHREAARAADPEAEKQESAPNPFADFLRDWISPRDQALLAAASAGATSARGDSPASASPAARAADDFSLLPSASVDFGSTGGASSPFAAPSFGEDGPLVGPAAAPNPFLEILLAPLPAPPADFSLGAARLETPVMAAPPAAVLAPPAAPVDNRPRPFVPPPLDDKRLPQLKRF